MRNGLRSTYAMQGDLERATAAWRSHAAPEPTLSEAARARVLDAVLQQDRRGGDLPGLVPLFAPGRAWVWAGALPALILTVGLGILAFPFDTGSHAPATTRVQAMKRSGEVVFLISNGGAEHRVSKRTIPSASPSGTAIKTQDGAFRDELDSEEAIVFYRID